MKTPPVKYGDYASLALYFAPGNVVYSRYWNDYDLVLSFRHPNAGGEIPWSSWSVTVAHCDADGNLLGEPRTHCTWPDRGDHVVSNVAAPHGAAA